MCALPHAGAPAFQKLLLDLSAVLQLHQWLHAQAAQSRAQHLAASRVVAEAAANMQRGATARAAAAGASTSAGGANGGAASAPAASASAAAAAAAAAGAAHQGTASPAARQYTPAEICHVVDVARRLVNHAALRGWPALFSAASSVAAIGCSDGEGLLTALQLAEPQVRWPSWCLQCS